MLCVIDLFVVSPTVFPNLKVDAFAQMFLVLVSHSPPPPGGEVCIWYCMPSSETVGLSSLRYRAVMQRYPGLSLVRAAGWGGCGGSGLNVLCGYLCW